MVLLVLTLGRSAFIGKEGKAGFTEVRFKAAAEQPKPKTDDREEKPKTKPDIAPAEQPSRTINEPVPVPPRAEPKPPPAAPLIKLSPSQMAATDITAIPRAPGPPAPARQSQMGPPGAGSSSPDTPRVSGSGPNGEPLYAASWFREPYESELSGYLSTASGPGWGLIACRTAPDYRVEDCVLVDEYPSGSNIARSVLAAAWQFRVRPPRVGGQLRIGEWVRIRIDYGVKRQ